MESTAPSKTITTANDSMKTTTERCPDTLRRRVDARDLKVPKPHVPRALVAADDQHPNGTIGHDHHNYTVLQQHVEFFDRNKDGIIYPWETFAGFRAIGFGWIISFLAMCFINLSMSYATQPSWIPSPVFSIYIKNMHKAKHGSDTGVYDHEGRFIPSKFEELFLKYARTQPDRLSFGELLDMSESLRDAFDFFGWVANKLEWGVTYWVSKDENGYMPKEAVRGVYDGSFFYYLEKKESAKSIAKFY
ncbi:hypothetical protein KP509_03G013900 [Ceratopteris richardii]|uniref:Caleosin n=1 Tax=Ceratopteris richardii TaxID=49495 RepID=A0A8T2V949_CERRI|nr:hypothetical protein KP509_03G013900 [Ceratopteris richardii]KAH7440848.1 hypothetical protein KP509_03G013900 [Ceratopteris richardii]KAH7440849.1 hypothetical protein KP509_03G013900 [Ceratopteris richardii]